MMNPIILIEFRECYVQIKKSNNDESEGKLVVLDVLGGSMYVSTNSEANDCKMNTVRICKWNKRSCLKSVIVFKGKFLSQGFGHLVKKFIDLGVKIQVKSDGSEI